MQAKEMVSDENKETFKKCAEIGNRLIGKKLLLERLIKIRHLAQRCLL